MFTRRLLAQPDCTFCALKHCKKCPPEGSQHARIAIVGEGPGRNEEREGRPFIGRAGQMFDWLLHKADIRRRDLWITNAALCMPRGITVDPERGYYKPEKEVLEESTQEYCKPRLLQELALVKPRVVLAMGNQALFALTGLKGISRRHGSVVAVDLQYLAGHTTQEDLSSANATYVVAVFHPSFLLRENGTRHIHAVVRVLKKAKRIAAYGVRDDIGQHLLVSPYHPRGAEVAISEFEWWAARLVREGADIAVDVETTRAEARKATLTVVGFGSATFKLGIAVTIRAWNKATGRFESCWTKEQAARINGAILKILKSRLTKWYWNYAFDVTVLEREFPDAREMLLKTVADGIHWHWIMQPDLIHGLAFACQTYLDIPAWKAHFQDLEATGKASHEDLLHYNAQDCLYTALVIPYLMQEVLEQRNDHLIPHQLRVAELARRAHLRGIPVDPVKWTELYWKWDALRLGTLKTMRDAIIEADGEQSLNDYVHAARVKRAKISARRTGKYKEPKRKYIAAVKFAPTSPDQARWYLFDFLRLTPIRMTAGGASRDKKKRQASYSYKGFLGYMKNPLVKAYVEFQEHRANISTLKSIRAHCDKDTLLGSPRLHASWNSTAQRGTRVSSSPNLQNQSKEMREVHRQVAGRVWVGADAAAIEYRIAACFAGIPELIELFNQEPFDEDVEPWKKYDPRYDAHSMIAVEVYGDFYEYGEPIHVSRFLAVKNKQAFYIGDEGPETAPFKELVSTREKYRTLVKRVTYALFYGAKPKKILQSLLEDRRLPAGLRATLTLKRISEIYHGFNARFPTWNAWAAKEMTYAQVRGYQQFAPLDRRRYWPVREVEENKIRNTPIQLAAGDVVNILFLRMQDRIDAEGLDAVFVLHGHDACYFDCAEEHAGRVKQIINEEFHYWISGPAGPVHIHGQASVDKSLAKVA